MDGHAEEKLNRNTMHKIKILYNSAWASRKRSHSFDDDAQKLASAQRGGDEEMGEQSKVLIDHQRKNPKLGDDEE